MNCLVCYDSIDNTDTKYITCSNPDCAAKVCTPCILELLDFCLDEKIMISCPQRGCGSHYIAKCFPRLTTKSTTEQRNLFQKLSVKYQDVCSGYLVSHTKGEVTRKASYRTAIETLRNQKLEHIKKAFPPAIVMAVTVAYSGDLRRIARDNHKLDELLGSSRNCVGFLCKGVMQIVDGGTVNERYRCGTCESDYCKRCERIMKQDHTCREEDVASVEQIERMVKCPTCKLPAVKSFGCNHMTCAVCRTHFDYVTGQVSRVGNHTRDDPLVLKDHTTLFGLYQHDYLTSSSTVGDGDSSDGINHINQDNPNVKILELLIEIDNMVPKQPSMVSIVNLIDRSVSTFGEIGVEIKKVLANKYGKYIDGCHKMRKYRNAIVRIQQYHNSRTLSADVLYDVIRLIGA